MEALTKVSGAIGVIAGALLTFSDFAGSKDIFVWLKNSLHIVTAQPLVFQVMDGIIYLAALGGVSVMLGGLLIYFKFRTTGKLFILVGAGMGFLGLFYSTTQAWIAGQDLVEFIKGYGSTPQGLGIILAFLSFSLA